MLTLSSARRPRTRPIQHDPQDLLAAFAAQRDVVNRQPVSPGHAGRDLPDSLERGQKAPLNTKSGHKAHSGFPDFDRTNHFNTRDQAGAFGAQGGLAVARFPTRRRGLAVAWRSGRTLERRRSPRQEICRERAVRVAVGQVDLRVDVRRLPLEPAANDELVVGRWTVNQQASMLADASRLSLLDNLPCWRAISARLSPLLLRGRHVVGQTKGRRAFFVRVGEDADVVELDGLRRKPSARRSRRRSRRGSRR